MSFYGQLFVALLACGATCAWLAERKGAPVTRWFVLGSLLGAFAVVALALQTSNAPRQR